MMNWKPFGLETRCSLFWSLGGDDDNRETQAGVARALMHPLLGVLDPGWILEGVGWLSGSRCAQYLLLRGVT